MSNIPTANEGKFDAKAIYLFDSSSNVFRPVTDNDMAGGAINTISTVNSTSTLLTAGSVFTGTAEDVTLYDSVIVAVKTDQNGAFSVQFSNDGTNWDSVLTRYYRTDQIEAPHRFTIARKYIRIVFTNTSSSDQTYLRLQTTFGNKTALNTPLDATVAQDYDSIQVRPTDFHTEVALSRRQGASTWNKFGYNTDVDIGTEVIASWGGQFQFLTSGEPISISSTSVADASGNSGINSIAVYGVDSNWNTQTVIYPMSGTVAVVSAENWIGINRIASFLAGSGRSNIGTINISSVGSSYQMAQMPVGGGVTQQLVYYVPDNHQFLAEWLHFDVVKIGGGTSPEVTFKGQVYNAVNNTIQEVYRGYIDSAQANNIDVNSPIPFPISEKSILYFTATTTQDSTSVAGRFAGELFRDPAA